MTQADISNNALKVLQRLAQHHYSAYLVGGSVRDLLLRKAPKDFDIATDAKPNQMKDLFRNCRLIGRRFRLAHILFGREIIEVATFRAAEDKPHAVRDKHHAGMITRDNVYGTIEEDVWRRDFTINALYYDYTTKAIIDFTGGMEDLQHRTIRLIGDPEQRFREDPVRMLRAIRFAGLLDFTIDTDIADMIPQLANLITHVPPARLFDELLKLYHCGKASQIHQLLQQYQLFDKLLPYTVTGKQADDAANELIQLTLRNTDERIQSGKPVTPAFLFAAMLWQPMQDEAQHLRKSGLPALVAVEQAMSTVIHRQHQVITIPKRISLVMREIWLLQYRLPRRYGKRPLQVLAHPRFRAGYDFLLLRAKIGEATSELAQWWTDFQTASQSEQEKMITEVSAHRRPRRKRS
jgi:poly(A) polymerase